MSTDDASKKAVRGKPRKVSELEGTAYHEAGHAVAAFALGRGIAEVTVIPDESGDYLGFCRHTPAPAWFDPENATDRRHRDWIEREILILFAGHAAEAHFRGRNTWRFAASDNHTAVNLASYFCCGLQETEKYLAWLHVRATNLILSEEHWPAVERLARLLLRERRVNGRRARQAFLAAREALFQGSNGASEPEEN